MELGLHVEPRLHLVPRVYVEQGLHVVAWLHLEPGLHLEQYATLVERAADHDVASQAVVHRVLDTERVTRSVTQFRYRPGRLSGS